MVFHCALKNKAKCASILLSFVSIVMILYYAILLKVVNAYQIDRHNLNEFMYIITPCLTLLTNLLLFQAVIDLQHQSLYYWPKPKPCLLWWMLVHSIVILLLLNEIMCCFYSFSGQDCWFPNAKNLSCHNQSSVHIIISLIMFIIEEIFIIFGMKIVMKVLENHKKEAI